MSRKPVEVVSNAATEQINTDSGEMSKTIDQKEVANLRVERRQLHRTTDAGPRNGGDEPRPVQRDHQPYGHQPDYQRQP